MREELRRLIRHKSLVVFSGMCASILVGVGFQSFIAAQLGTSGIADVYYLGTAVPTLIATALLGSAPNAFIRFAVSEPGRLRLERRSVASRLLLLSSAITLIVTLLAVAEFFSALPVLGVSQRRELGWFLLITAPVPMLALLAALGSVRALARQQFFFATFGGAINGVGLAAAAVALLPWGLHAPQLAVAVDCGYLAQLAFVWRKLRSSDGRHADDRGAISANHAPVGAFALLLLASALYKSQPLVERTVGAVLGSGVPAALGYADKVTAGLVQLATFGFALAALPAMSRALSDGEAKRAVYRLGSALEATCASTVAIVAFAAVSSADLVHVLYQRGTFGANAAHVTQILILCALPSVALSSVAGPLAALEYAAGNVRQVVRIGLAGFVAGTAGTIALAGAIGYPGIVLGTGIGYATTLVLFARRTSTVLGGWSWRRFATTSGPRIGAAFAGSAGIALVGASALAVHSNVVLAISGLGIRLALGLACSLGIVVVLRRRTALSRPSFIDARDRLIDPYVIWLTLGERAVASSRVRAFNVADGLASAGISTKCIRATGFLGRVRAGVHLLRATRPTIVVVQKILYGQVMLRLLRRRARLIVWECDDAMHLGFPGCSARELRRTRRLVDQTLQAVDVVTTSNPLLAEEFRPKSGRTALYRGPAPPARSFGGERELLAVWLGSPSTERYLELLGSAPTELAVDGWKLVAIGATEASERLGWQVVPWTASAQETWLSRACVGVMPQARDPWSDRKQAYKLFEYMAHGVVPVASDVPAARDLLSSPELRRLLVGAGDDWRAVVESAAERRLISLSEFGRVLDEHSLATAVTTWLDATRASAA